MGNYSKRHAKIQLVDHWLLHYGVVQWHLHHIAELLKTHFSTAHDILWHVNKCRPSCFSTDIPARVSPASLSGTGSWIIRTQYWEILGIGIWMFKNPSMKRRIIWIIALSLWFLYTCNISVCFCVFANRGFVKYPLSFSVEVERISALSILRFY